MDTSKRGYALLKAAKVVQVQDKDKPSTSINYKLEKKGNAIPDIVLKSCTIKVDVSPKELEGYPSKNDSGDSWKNYAAANQSQVIQSKGKTKKNSINSIMKEYIASSNQLQEDPSKSDSDDSYENYAAANQSQDVIQSKGKTKKSCSIKEDNVSSNQLQGDPSKSDSDDSCENYAVANQSQDVIQSKGKTKKSCSIKEYNASSNQLQGDPSKSDSDDSCENYAAPNQSQVVIQSKGKTKKLKNFCYYCKTDVTNFARHVTVHHSAELDVIQLNSKPVNSLERKRLLAKLRNKGIYLKHEDDGPRKVRRSTVLGRSSLPCDNCLGYFSSKLLYRHRKKCSGKSGPAQSIGQNVLASHIKVDERLKREIFPRMRADKISLEAKTDALICAFGSRFLRVHREHHFATVTSRKMRELARILIELKKINPEIKSLFDALQPKYFDNIVQATQIASGYKSSNDSFDAPSYAMNIVNSFKQCCDIAINFGIKKKANYESITAAEAEAQLRTMLHLFTTNWRYEISSQAANNLNLKRWNKITIVPLANDLKIMKDFLIDLSKKAAAELQVNTNKVSAYNTLLETSYCQVLLLNRRRPGELQRMKLDTYLSCTNDKSTYEEFSLITSPSEQILLKTFKRVVIRGKRHRGVPVLFSKDVQSNINLLIRARPNIVPEENIFLFGKPNSRNEISGYKILRKYARLSGAKNPDAISSTRLRKHLATISQLFNMTEADIEQLALFMGHTVGVHRGSYRLPDDVYQTAKLAKLLLVMETGSGESFKGKSLDDIQLNMDENIMTETNEPEDKEYENFQEDVVVVEAEKSKPQNVKNAIVTSTTKKRTLVPWTEDQKVFAKRFFAKNIKKEKLQTGENVKI
ncbi:uncharacterized protein LOC126891100 [Diabrotica virgifera virgifera]|uniref:Tyr recombinase domain-containing protein n=1 Tax=Diabrotica virgifera virgifera TaxID=50390 RepID=A0ABM5L1C5_DIAVI|nr:uncharacterized protein LOC126891100 [Diabrotica virgifera virgifera]